MCSTDYTNAGWELLTKAVARKPHRPFPMTLASRSPIYAFLCPFCRTIEHSSVSTPAPLCLGGYPSRLNGGSYVSG